MAVRGWYSSRMPEMLSSGRFAELPVPFTRSYWVRPGQLLAGFYPGDKDPAEAERKLRGLIRCGVATVINLMEATEKDHRGKPFADYAQRMQGWAREEGRSVSCLRFPIRDLNVPTVERMRDILDAIDEALTREQVVYVHCWGGRGRTGTVVACHLLRHRLVREGEALEAVKALTAHKQKQFWPTPEMDCQKEFVRKWRLGQ